MTTGELIQKLEAAWDSDGFLDFVRRGRFDEKMGLNFLAILCTASIKDDELVPKRLIALLWYLPSFLEWQKERVAEAGGDIVAYKRFITQVHNALEEVLGVP